MVRGGDLGKENKRLLAKNYICVYADTATEAGHWKCPTCGAVNGSTATSCRMCFTARP